MSKSQNEKLSDILVDIDEKLLANAYETDTPEKLKQYAKEKKKATHVTPLFRKIATLSACFIIIVGIIFTVPALFKNSNEKPHIDNQGSTLPPWLIKEEAVITIDSIDMLNYYSAIKVLAAKYNDVTVSIPQSNIITSPLQTCVMPTKKSMYGIMLINENDIGVGYDTPPEDFSAASKNDDEEKIYYYELDPNEKFTVTRVIFFQVEIKNKNGFLASKIGTGITDVVITENNLEPMITFKNGNKYFSCCENTLLKNGKLYSTHKYIDGFYLVKNLEQDNYSFSVEYDNFNLNYTNAHARSITCASYKNGGENPDGDLSVISATYIYNDSAEFTIADLEEYFNSVSFPEHTSEESPPEYSAESERPALISEIYSSGIYEFELNSDGTFIYYSVGGSENAVYRKGTYSRNSSSIELSFTYEGETVETASCKLTESNGFIYSGSEYVLYLSKEQT